MIKAIAIDDEPVALDILRIHAERVPFITLEKVFTSARAALDYLATTGVDVIFLDINMPDMGGLEFAALADPAIQIIFTTAHSRHAVSGYDMDITDFLLKPISYQRFFQACERAEKNTGKLEEDKKTPQKESLFVKDGYNWVRVYLNDLLYVKAEDNYIKLVETKRQTMVRMTVQEFLNKVSPDAFIRTHRSYAVKLSAVQQLQNNTLLVNDELIPISKSFAIDVRKRLTGLRDK